MKTQPLFFSFLFIANCVVAQMVAPTVNLTVSVQDSETHSSLDGVHLKAAYKGDFQGGSSWAEADTETNGNATISGRSLWSIPITATKTGYYPSSVDVQTCVWSQEQKKNIYSDQSVLIIMRKIKNPTPMYSWQFTTNLYQIGMPVGFDLLTNDWVVPYGRGTISDFIFEVKGFYLDRRNYDSELVWSFSNNGDGFVPFIADMQSQLKSPYFAPEQSYQKVKNWRKYRKPIPNQRFKAEVVDDSKLDANYIFRIRTVLDENSNLVSALYGKIYGDFIFGGASKGGSYIRGCQIYLNPTPNDRNLEFDLSRNLMTNLSRLHQPKFP